MDNLTGLSSNAPSYPSFPLKEQLLNVLESKEIDVDALLKLLGVELKASQHLKTVHEVVNKYEEQNGRLSLQAWESIFQGLGYSKDFLRVIANFNEKRHCQGTADLAVANLHTRGDKKNDESGALSNGAAGSCSGLSNNDPGAKLKKTNPQFCSFSHDDTSSSPFAALSASVDAEIDTFDKKTKSAAYSPSSSLPIERPFTKNSSEDNNDKVLKSKSEFESTIPRRQNALARELISPPGFSQTDNEWPEWSLPPPERHQLREKRLPIHDNQDFVEQSRSAAVSTANRKNSFSCLADNSTLNESPTTDEMVPSPPEWSASGTISGETETPHNDSTANIKQSCVKKQDCGTLIASQEKKEDGHVSNNAALLVTRGPLLTSSVDFVACSSSSENLNSQQSRIPAENDDIVGDIGLLEEMSKEIESLRLYETFMSEENDILLHNEAYLLQELRMLEDQHTAVCCENLALRQEVETLRTEKAELLVRTEELQAQLNEKELEHRIVQETLRTENEELLEQKEELEDRLSVREFEVAEKNEVIQTVQEENDWLRERVRLPIPEEDD